MAVRLASNEVADLCIGKPPLRLLPASATTVGGALIALMTAREPYLAVISIDPAAPERKDIGKISVSDVLCFLCADGNVASPNAALEKPVSALLPKGANLVRLVEPQLSILGALNLIVDGAQNLLLPIVSIGRKKPHHGVDTELCWLTHEDFVRYFLNSISVFSPTHTLSIDALGLVREAVLAVRHDEPGLSLLPLIRHALADQTAVAVVSDDDRLLGEISPSALSACDKTATLAAAIATLTAGALMTLLDYCGSPPESLLLTIKAGLREKGWQEMLELMEDELSSFSSSSSWPSASSSSSDEDSCGGRRPQSLCMGRHAEEPEVCHPGSSLVAVMVQALANRVSYLWVVDEEDHGLIGIVTFADMLRIFQGHLQPSV
ncbi:CBS domain-containing protein CBSX5-like [Canna indica]|uniref:CBS domain-containing protein CBSX5-like n=1 Tax=Canna indica TaxID=4628 RepID=A0AAQ3Q638_9LILI|nr:CBS domain-containing protein CBSX5-like [Canna indica]